MRAHKRSIGFWILSGWLALSGATRAADAATPAVDAAPAVERLSSQEIHKLVAPIALYPDGLLAQVLPASTFPVQIVEASRFAQTAADPKTPPPDSRWDSSVIALLQYPTVLKKLNDDLPWLEALGTAVTYQMEDVTQAIQKVRADAAAAGNLSSNAKQRVSTEGETVSIAPADPQVVYVPSYDPGLVSQPYYDATPLFDYGIGYPVGLWFDNEIDWANRRIWCHHFWAHGHWHGGEERFPWHAHPTGVAHWHVADRPSAAGVIGSHPISAAPIQPSSNTQSRVNFISAGSHTRTWDANEMANRARVAAVESPHPENHAVIGNRLPSQAARPSINAAPTHAPASSSPRYSYSGNSRGYGNLPYRSNSFGAYLRQFSRGGSARGTSHRR